MLTELCKLQLFFIVFHAVHCLVPKPQETLTSFTLLHNIRIYIACADADIFKFYRANDILWFGATVNIHKMQS